MLQWDYKKEKWLHGWYNGYTQKIYKKNKYDYQLTKERVNSDIEKSVIKLKENPKYACNFFYEKVTSQWNNPTFQCFWIYSKRKSDRPKYKVVKSILSENRTTNKILTNYMNILQTLILFGTIMYIVIDSKNIKFKELIFAIIFIGGFVFHLIWEAKCQYTITYFVLLIPYSIVGYKKTSEKILQIYNKSLEKLKK